MKLACLLLAATLPIFGVSAEVWEREMDAAMRLMHQHRYADAEPLYRRALELARAPGTGDMVTALSLNDLAYCHRLLGRLLEAEREFSQALQIMQRRLGLANSKTVAVVVNLTSIYVETSRLARAESLLRRYLDQETPLAREDHASLLGELGAVLVLQSRFDEAEAHLQRALGVLEADTRPKFQERTVTTLSNLSTFYLRMNRLADAVAYSDRARTRLAMLDNPPPVLWIKTVANAATLSARTGNFAAAAVLYESALRKCDETWGSRHFLAGQILPTYAATLRKLGRRSEAKLAEQRAQSILREFRNDNLLGLTVDAAVLPRTGPR